MYGEKIQDYASTEPEGYTTSVKEHLDLAEKILKEVQDRSFSASQVTEMLRYVKDCMAKNLAAQVDITKVELENRTKEYELITLPL
jgi:hypothetical protein